VLAVPGADRVMASRIPETPSLPEIAACKNSRLSCIWLVGSSSVWTGCLAAQACGTLFSRCDLRILQAGRQRHERPDWGVFNGTV
jgi:hypothetical protein